MDDLAYYRSQFEHYFPPWPWALDFCRAMAERPLWARLLFRLVLGKYAYREFIGLQNAFLGTGNSPFWEGVGPGCGYFKDKVPARWWKERDYQPPKGAL